ncbi:MAG: hypothetical protein H6R11_1976, partial [Proteobacteria bacterium]|nr:hypothetical protein [Pseudomonadota bacterium]
QEDGGENEARRESVEEHVGTGEIRVPGFYPAD